MRKKIQYAIKVDVLGVLAIESCCRIYISRQERKAMHAQIPNFGNSAICNTFLVRHSARSGSVWVALVVKNVVLILLIFDVSIVS